jgi:hypothetical protein
MSEVSSLGPALALKTVKIYFLECQCRSQWRNLKHSSWLKFWLITLTALANSVHKIVSGASSHESWTKKVREYKNLKTYWFRHESKKSTIFNDLLTCVKTTYLNQVQYDNRISISLNKIFKMKSCGFILSVLW